MHNNILPGDYSFSSPWGLKSVCHVMMQVPTYMSTGTTIPITAANSEINCVSRDTRCFRRLDVLC